MVSDEVTPVSAARVMASTQMQFGTLRGSSRIADSGRILRDILTISPESPCVVATFSPEL